jgi:site-specific recombinase XerD
MFTIMQTRDKVIVLEDVINAWAQHSTNQASARKRDLVRDKTRNVSVFFTWCGKSPEQVQPGDILEWISVLEARGYSQSSIYGAISKISAFFDWLLLDPNISKRIPSNPTKLVRPKTPRAYDSESVKSLSDKQLSAMLEIIKRRVDPTGKRDLALFYFYLLTGYRRSEIANLRHGDIEFTDDGLIFSCRLKGGARVSRYINAPVLKNAIKDYLGAAGQTNDNADEYIWRRFDRAAPGARLGDYGISQALAGYAAQAGIKNFHLHALRHTFARLAGDIGGEIAGVSEALNHSNPNTTRIYLQRLSVRADKFSNGICDRFALSK